jgi:hypothetical protein
MANSGNKKITARNRNRISRSLPHVMAIKTTGDQHGHQQQKRLAIFRQPVS